MLTYRVFCFIVNYWVVELLNRNREIFLILLSVLTDAIKFIIIDLFISRATIGRLKLLM